MCVLCLQENGQQLLLYSRNPNYVVDINIYISQSLVTEILVILFLSLFGSFSCCCCLYTTWEVRNSLRCLVNFFIGCVHIAYVYTYIHILISPTPMYVHILTYVHAIFYYHHRASIGQHY